MSKESKKALKSWHLLIIGIIGLVVGSVTEGISGDLITIFLGHLILLFALITFIKEQSAKRRG